MITKKGRKHRLKTKAQVRYESNSILIKINVLICDHVSKQ